MVSDLYLNKAVKERGAEGGRGWRKMEEEEGVGRERLTNPQHLS